MRLPFLFLILLLNVPPIVLAQGKVKTKDSVNVKDQIEGFYAWYIGMVKNRKLGDFSPRFIRQDDGMTTLDFTKYGAGLRRYKFTEVFILRKINDYKECVDNLSKIPFDKFSTFTDLDDFENINCDFGNRYEWTGGMEPKDKATLSGLKAVDEKTIVGRVEFTSYSTPDGTAEVTFKKFRREWWIDHLILK